MIADTFWGWGIFILLLAVPVYVALENRARLRQELAAGIDRKDWRMEERHNGVFMVNAKRGEVLTLIAYEDIVRNGGRHG